MENLHYKATFNQEDAKVKFIQLFTKVFENNNI
jgi:hypothetical protein